MEKDYLHFLINEEIYRIPDGSKQTKTRSEPPERSTADEIPANSQKEPVEDQKREKIETASSPESKEVEATATASHHESPEIPAIKVGAIQELAFAVFHESTQKEELDLIHKIIDACQLKEGSYKIFGGGFDRDVQFKKALVFVSTGKKYYEPIPHEKGFFLCSRPASVLLNDQNQKLQLWNALKQFLEL